MHARSVRVGTGERESGRDRGQQLVVRGMLRSPTGKLDMRVARIPPIGAWSRYLKGKSAHAALELTHVEPVDERSETRKADAVWHFWERAGQRHDALKRVAQTPECRFLFTVHMQHVQASFGLLRPSMRISRSHTRAGERRPRSSPCLTAGARALLSCAVGACCTCRCGRRWFEYTCVTIEYWLKSP